MCANKGKNSPGAPHTPFLHSVQMGSEERDFKCLMKVSADWTIQM